MPVVTSSEAIRRLREGKDSLRQARRQAPLHEKLRGLVKAQHLYVQVVGSRRPLKPWQRPWNILNEVAEGIVIGVDRIEPTKPSAVGSAHARWTLQTKLQDF
jgi:hypothetical protein